MKIGDLRQRILFQEEVKTDDDAHGHTQSWKDIAEVWANVQPLSGRELYYAKQLKNTTTHVIKIRYRNDITVDRISLMRIIFETRIIKIDSLIDLEEKKIILELRCTEDKSN